MHVDDILYVLWSEAHAETGQVSVAEGEEDHENDVPGVVSEHHGQVVSGLNVTEHEERNEHQACDDQDGQPDAVFTGLNREQSMSDFNINVSRHSSSSSEQTKSEKLITFYLWRHHSVHVNTVLEMA